LIALDTNILVYAESPDDLEGRHEKALNLIAAASTIESCLPLQVIGEFLNVCRRKKVMGLAAGLERAHTYLDLFETPATAFVDMAQAADLSRAFDLQFFDALIIAVSTRAGATILLSEDMQDGLEVDGLCVVNPFVAANETLLADYFGFGL
jgi:predicted nucleic acid-binding protein